MYTLHEGKIQNGVPFESKGTLNSVTVLYYNPGTRIKIIIFCSDGLMRSSNLRGYPSVFILFCLLLLNDQESL